MAVLGVQLGQVAPACERALEHAAGQLGRHERHASAPSTRRTMRSDTAITLSYPRASGWSSRA